MLKGLLAVAMSLRRIAASLRAVSHQLQRIADALEASGGLGGGVSLRTFYRDERPGAVEDASVFAPNDADFWRLEQLVQERQRAGRPVEEDEDLDAALEDWRG
jgi:hypothetical protein